MKNKSKIFFILIFSFLLLILIGNKSLASDEVILEVPELPVVEPKSGYYQVTVIKYNGDYYLLSIYLVSQDTDIKINSDGSSNRFSGYYPYVYYLRSPYTEWTPSGWASTGVYQSSNRSFGALGSNEEYVYLDMVDYSAYTPSGNYILKSNGQQLFPPKELEPDKPFISTTTETLSTGNFDYLSINSGDFYGDNFQDFYLLAYNYYASDVENPNLYPQKEILISGGRDNKYYTNDYDGSYIYMIPMSDLGIVFRNNGKYGLKLATKQQVEFDGKFIDTYNYLYTVTFSVTNLSLEDEERTAQDVMISQLEEQNKKLEENNKQSKNIFEKIGDILSYINPLSENFFAYKLLNLLYEGLKMLFIPSDEFFSNWFTDLNNTFKDQFGILYYPVGVVIEFLDSLEPNLTAREPIINIPNLSFDLFGHNVTLLSSTSYNLNSLLENEKFATVHSYYLFFVNVIFTIGVIRFASKIAVEIFGGIDDTATQIYDNYQESKTQKRPLGYKPNIRRGGR